MFFTDRQTNTIYCQSFDAWEKKKIRFKLGSVENIVGKGVYSSHQHHLPQLMFSKDFFLQVVESWAGLHGKEF